MKLMTDDATYQLISNTYVDLTSEKVESVISVSFAIVG